MNMRNLLLAAAFLTAAAPMAAQDINLMLGNAETFIGTPYAVHPLDGDDMLDTEELNYMCDEVDCTTLVESVLAMSLCPEQGNDMKEADFAQNLQKVRYRDGKIDGFTSRLHYISDWINNGVRNGFLTDVTAVSSPHTMKLSVNYMSTHPEQYKQLARSKENVAKMRAYEQALTGQTVHYLPKAQLPAEGFAWIRPGDIIAITSATPGMDVAHMGIAIYVKGSLCLLHASSKAGKVLVDPVPLTRMLESNKDWTGIRVVRMKKD